MELMSFRVSGKIKEINRKKVLPGQIIERPSCEVGCDFPYPPRTEYWEIILEGELISPDFGNMFSNGKAKLVFFGEKYSGDFEKKFAVGEKYLFHCTGGVDYYFPHDWEKTN